MFNLRGSAPSQTLVPDFRSAHVITILNCSSQHASWEYWKILQIKIQFVVLSLLNCVKGSIVSFWAGKTKCQNCLLWPAWRYTWKYTTIFENILLSGKKKGIKVLCYFQSSGIAAVRPMQEEWSRADQVGISVQCATGWLFPFLKTLPLEL